jgi:hypothetical protein
MTWSVRKLRAFERSSWMIREIRALVHPVGELRDQGGDVLGALREILLRETQRLELGDRRGRALPRRLDLSGERLERHPELVRVDPTGLGDRAPLRSDSVGDSEVLVEGDR